MLDKTVGDLELIERIALFLFEYKPRFNTGNVAVAPDQIGVSVASLDSTIKFYPTDKNDVIADVVLASPFHTVHHFNDYLFIELHKRAPFSVCYLFKTRAAFERYNPPLKPVEDKEAKETKSTKK